MSTSSSQLYYNFLWNIQRDGEGIGRKTSAVSSKSLLLKHKDCVSNCFNIEHKRCAKSTLKTTNLDTWKTESSSWIKLRNNFGDKNSSD